MPTLLSWCPGKSPPDHCDQCVCQVIDAQYLPLAGKPPYSLEAQFSMPLARIEQCSPKFAVELWQDQSAYGGASLAWMASVLQAQSPQAGASATMTFYYRVQIQGGDYHDLSLMTLSGATVLVPDGQRAPLEWRTTELFQAIYDSDGHFVKNILYYTEWTGGGTDFIQSRSEEHTSELQSRSDLVCRLLLEK